MNILSKIQSELKAPKNQYNKFGKYKYRSCEDIIEALKPLLKNHNAALLLNDEIVQIGDRYYIKATATIKADSFSESAVAYARENESKKGMDEAQITGSASSYARKYALNGLLAIDDTKDSDATSNGEKAHMDVTKGLSGYQISELRKLVTEKGFDDSNFLAKIKKHSYSEITSGEYDALIKRLKAYGRD